MISLSDNMQQMKDSNSVFFIELYVIHLPTGNIYLCANDVNIKWYPLDIVANGTVICSQVVYNALPIQRGQFSCSSGSQVTSVELTISNVNDIFSNIVYNSSDVRGCLVDIYQIPYPPLSIYDFKFLYRGYMDNPVLNEGDGTFKVDILALLPNLRSHRVFSLACNACFGSSYECGAIQCTKEGWVEIGSDQNTIVSTYFGNVPDDYWINGTVTVGYETRAIKHSVGNTLFLMYPLFQELKMGTKCVAKTGCDHTYNDCIRHGNLSHFGGFPSIPFEENIRGW